MSSLSAASTTVNSGALCSHDKSPQDFDKDDETAGSAATAIDTPSTPCSLNQEGVNPASVANSTPRYTNSDASVKFRNAQSLEPEELRHKRTELRHSVASKEQTLHNLNLVKTHRTKVRCLKYVYRVPTHLESRGESGKVRELIWSGKVGEFCCWSGNFGSLRTKRAIFNYVNLVREKLRTWSGKVREFNSL